MASIPFNQDFIPDQSRFRPRSIVTTIPFNLDLIPDQTRLQNRINHDFKPIDYGFNSFQS